MLIHTYSPDYIIDTARMAVLKAKAICACQSHPEILLLSTDHDALERAYMIGKNTLVYHDKMFMYESLADAIKHELSTADVECAQCGKNKLD